MENAQKFHRIIGPFLQLKGSFSFHRCLTFSLYTLARLCRCVCVCVYDKWLYVYIRSCLAGQTWKWIPLPLSISSRLNRLEHSYNARNAHALFLCTHEFGVYFDHFTVNCTLNRWYMLLFRASKSIITEKIRSHEKIEWKRESERCFIYLFLELNEQVERSVSCLDSFSLPYSYHSLGLIKKNQKKNQ